MKINSIQSAKHNIARALVHFWRGGGDVMWGEGRCPLTSFDLSQFVVSAY